MMRARTTKARTVTRDAHRLLRFLSERSDTLSPMLILTHDYPDPDALASAFALKILCETRFNVSCRIAYGGAIGRTENREMVARLHIPAHKLRPRDFRVHRALALVDTQPGFRNNSFPAGRKATLIIDQHASLRRPTADCAIVNVDCGATSVILGQALLQTKLDIPRAVATALSYGILTDTLNLYRAEQSVIIKTYVDLLPRCDLRQLSRIQNPSRSRRFFTTLSRGIQNAIVCRDIIVAHLGGVETPDLVSQVADFLLSYRHMNWSLATGHHRGRLFMSMRSKRLRPEAGEVLRNICGDRANAGGHGGVAGGSFAIDRPDDDLIWETEENALLVRLLERLHVSSRWSVEFPFRLR